MSTAQQLGLIGNSIKVQSLPTASAETFGAGNRFYTLIGQQEGYITGHTYHTIVANDVYSWEDVACGNYNMLDNIPVINQDLTASDFTPVANTYYRHTGSTTSTFTQGIIYLYDTAYHKLGESGGSASVSDVQVAGTSVVTDGVAKIPSATRTTNGVVTMYAQIFGGVKTFNDGIVLPIRSTVRMTAANGSTFYIRRDGYEPALQIEWGSLGAKDVTIKQYAASANDYGKINFKNIGTINEGTPFLAPTTWSSGQSGALTLTEGGTYQFYAGSATKTNYTLLYVVLGTESIAYAGKNMQLEIDTNNVVHVYDMSQAEPAEVTVTLNYRRIGI